jgi:hypothetical protein
MQGRVMKAEPCQRDRDQRPERAHVTAITHRASLIESPNAHHISAPRAERLPVSCTEQVTEPCRVFHFCQV